MRLGTYWLVRIGIVMVLTALVFFGNLAYQNFISKLGPGGKVALLYLASAGLLVAGGWWQRKAAKESLKNYAQVLFAGGGLLALRLTDTNFSVSSGFGFVALMGVAVQTSVILYSFINKLRLEGKDILTATHEASLLRLRPIMMTALVACIGLLPAAMSTGIGSDSQKPFAIVIVGGLASRLLLSIFLAPVLYALVANKDDVLKV